MTKRLALALLFVLVTTASGLAVTFTTSESITVLGTPIGFTASKIQPGAGHGQALFALCRNEGAQIRFTVDPTVTVTGSTNGVVVNDGEYLPGLNDALLLVNFRAIITGNTSSKLTCFYFG